MTFCIVPAAGFSRRFKGVNKLFLKIGGKTILEHTLSAVTSSSVFDGILVVTREDLLGGISSIPGDFTILVNKKPEEGLSSSIKEGLLYLKDLKPTYIAIMLGDLPLIKPNTIRFLYGEFQKRNTPFLYPTYQGKRGHPFFSKYGWIMERFGKIRGDKGLREFIGYNIEVDDPGVVMDVDSEEDVEKIKKLYLSMWEVCGNLGQKVRR